MYWRLVYMKKIIASSLSLFVLISVTGCVWDPESYYFDYNKLSNEIVSVDLVEYDNTLPQILYGNGEILKFNFDKMNLLETLETKQIDSFIADLSKIHLFLPADDLSYANSPIGYCIKLNCENGDFIILSSTLIDGIAYGHIVRYDSSGTAIGLIATCSNRGALIDLANKYFNTELE